MPSDPMSLKAEAVEAITRAICIQGNIHRKCTFPDCSCVVSPKQARAALPALLALLDARGWQIVPKEPIDAMYREALKRTRDPGYGHAADALGGAVYRAMLSSAPAPFAESKDGN